MLVAPNARTGLSDRRVCDQLYAFSRLIFAGLLPAKFLSIRKSKGNCHGFIGAERRMFVCRDRALKPPGSWAVFDCFCHSTNSPLRWTVANAAIANTPACVHRCPLPLQRAEIDKWLNFST